MCYIDKLLLSDVLFIKAFRKKKKKLHGVKIALENSLGRFQVGDRHSVSQQV